MFAGALWAARKSFRGAPSVSEKISRILDEIQHEFGLKSRLAAPLAGMYLRVMIAREKRRLRNGWTYEPPTFCEAGPLQ